MSERTLYNDSIPGLAWYSYKDMNRVGMCSWCALPLTKRHVKVQHPDIGREELVALVCLDCWHEVSSSPLPEYKQT